MKGWLFASAMAVLAFSAGLHVGQTQGWNAAIAQIVSPEALNKRLENMLKICVPHAAERTPDGGR